MSADELREAARLMREPAEAATPGPWTLRQEDHDMYGSPLNTGVMSGENVVLYGGQVLNVDAAHIASWHPAVALAVATWLDSHADIHTLRTCDERLTVPCPALAVARAYLGTEVTA